MKRTKVFGALACALLVFGLSGCGTSNKLQTITVTATLINGVAPTSQTGFYNLQGSGGTIQFAATGEYTSAKTKDLTNVVTWSVTLDPAANVDAFGAPMIPPCPVGTCPNPTQPPPYTTGTVEYNQTGMITAVEPAVCSWEDVAAVVTVGTAPTPAWVFSGDYVVTATFGGITSQPVYVPVASAAGNPNNPSIDTATNPNAGTDNNPNYLCGPSSSSSS